MKSLINKRIVVAGVTGLVMLGGASGAIAATQSSPAAAESHTAGSYHHGLKAGAGRNDVAAATYLGITPTVLRADRKKGESLATLAASTPGKSAAGLKAAIIAADTTRLNAAVADGKITRTQEAQRLSKIANHIDKRLDRTSTSGQNVAWVRDGDKAWAHAAHTGHKG